MIWSLYACRYGTQPDLPARQTVADIARLAPGAADVPFAYFFWLARSDSRCVLIDCGVSPAQARARGRRRLASPTALLAEIGISPEEVDDIVLTHLHYDHAGNLADFPKARLHVHAAEWAWATGPAMADPEAARFYAPEITAHLLHRLHQGDLRLIDGDRDEAAGLAVERLEGHCPGQMIVTVPTAAGAVVLASDAAHLGVNLQDRNPFPILHDRARAAAGLDRLAALGRQGARIVPGHDLGPFTSALPVGTSGNIVALDQVPAHV